MSSLEQRVFELETEVATLRAQLEGDLPKATRFLQRKDWAQRRALAAMNKKLASQRFVLRALSELGRTLSPEEYRKAREAEQNEQLRAMIPEKQ